jgi:hypothetical protein
MKKNLKKRIETYRYTLLPSNNSNELVRGKRPSNLAELDLNFALPVQKTHHRAHLACSDVVIA